MPSEIDYAKAGYYLEYLQHLSSELNEIADIKGTDVNWLINRVCTFSYEYNFPEANKSYDIKKEWIQLLSVYGNLIARGVPTYPTFQVEKLLLENFSSLIKIDKSPISYSRCKSLAFFCCNGNFFFYIRFSFIYAFF